MGVIKEAAAQPVQIVRHWRNYALDHHSRTCPNENLGWGVSDKAAHNCQHCNGYTGRRRA